MTALLSPVELRPMLQAVIDANPDATNPGDPNSIDDTCVYTDMEDGGGHCLVGAAAAEQGWTLPKVDDSRNAEPVAVVAASLGWPITEAGIEFLADCQDEADAGLPWSSITLPEVP